MRVNNILHDRGQAAEHVAYTYLKQCGLQLLERNFRCKMGEIDLIMRDLHTVVFIEVRYRQSIYFGSGAASVHRQKQTRIIKAAQFYLQKNRLWEKIACRFDVIAFTNNKLEWIKDAFQI